MNTLASFVSRGHEVVNANSIAELVASLREDLGSEEKVKEVVNRLHGLTEASDFKPDKPIYSDGHELAFDPQILDLLGLTWKYFNG